MIAEITIHCSFLLQIITQQEVRERENQDVVYAKKRGRRWKSRESSGSTLDDTKKERSSSKKQGNKKELTPYVENSAYSRNSNMEKENHNSSSDKPAEVIPNGDDKVIQLAKLPLFGNKFQKELYWVT